MDTLNNIISAVVQFIGAIDPNNVNLLLALLGLSGLHEVVKQFLKARAVKLNDATNILLALALASIPAAVNYGQHFASQNPGVLSVQILAFFGAMQPLYLLIVKPGIAYALALLQDARAYRDIQQNLAPATPPELDING